jgi:hypothetical protein
MSFAQRHHSLFPTYYNGDGAMTRQVPMPMLALIATAVSITNRTIKNLALTSNTSFMPHFMNGAPGRISLQNSLRTCSLMCTKVMSTHSASF